MELYHYVVVLLFDVVLVIVLLVLVIIARHKGSLSRSRPAVRSQQPHHQRVEDRVVHTDSVIVEPPYGGLCSDVVSCYLESQYCSTQSVGTLRRRPGYKFQPTPREIHRSLLMRISNQLSFSDVKKLTFTCDIPESRWSKLENGYEVFKYLEEQKKLEPGEYDYLAFMLWVIERVDLANKLPPCQPPTEHPLNGPDCRMYLLGNNWKELRCVYTRERVELHKFTTGAGEPILRKTLGELIDRLILAWGMKEPGRNWRLNSPRLDDRVIQTLRVISAFVRAKLEMYPLPDLCKMEDPQARCERYFGEFSQIVNELEWKRPQRDFYMNKNCPHVDPADAVFTHIKKMSGFVFRDNVRCEEIEVAMAHTSVLKAHHRSGWQMLVIIEWLRTLCLLHADSDCEFSLSKDMYIQVLKSIIREHKDNINRVYHLVRPILGEEVMKKVEPLLSSSSNAKPATLPSIWDIKAVALYILFLELAGHAMGCNIDPAQVAKDYTDRYHSEFDAIVREHYVHSRKIAITTIEREIRESEELLRQMHHSSIDYMLPDRLPVAGD